MIRFGIEITDKQNERLDSILSNLSSERAKIVQKGLTKEDKEKLNRLEEKAYKSLFHVKQELARIIFRDFVHESTTKL